METAYAFESKLRSNGFTGTSDIYDNFGTICPPEIYYIKLISEDVDGNRGEVTYQISVDSADTDADGGPDAVDNCPATCNPVQLDADMDGIGDLCDWEPGCTYGGCTPCEEPCPPL